MSSVQITDDYWVVNNYPIRRARDGSPWVILWQWGQRSTKHLTLLDAALVAELGLGDL